MDLLFSSIAFAQDAAAAAPKGPSLFENLGLLIGPLAIMYFFILRPQSKRAREQQKMQTSLKAGDEVVTTGGIIGKVRSVADAFVTVEVAPNTAIKVTKPNITMLTKDLQKEPAKDLKGQPAKV
jgi:preprotein translocase subunit YajC